MTCFWDGIFRKLNTDDWKFIGYKPIDIKSLIKLLKSKSKHMNNVVWQGGHLEKKFVHEAINDIKEYKIETISGGHLTSGCDVFLLIICELFQVDILHHYNGNLIKYKNKKGGRRTLTFNSTKSHFS